jgi:tol-pal system protein YbgF
MKPMRRRWTKTGAGIVAAFGLVSFAAGAAQTQGIQPAAPANDARDLQTRLQRIERDLRDLQAETYRRAPGDRTAPPPAVSPDPTPAPAAETPPPVMPDLNPIMRRMDELAESLGRLTGQMEEVGHQVDLLSQRTDRLQKDLDFQAAQRKALPEMPVAPAEAGNEVASVDPGQTAPPPRGTPPANLGQIPAGAPLPVPSNTPTDPKREFDAAMNLLSRAQYDKASEAFRNFADAHPDEERAADALYWTADIAYSAKKDYGEAARDFAELLKKYPKAQRAPEVMLKLGLALFELGQTKEGCAALAALPAKYPDAAPAIATRAKSGRTENKCR